MQLQIYFPSLSGVWQWWLSLLDLLCSEVFADFLKSSVILRLLTSINSKIVGGHLFLNATSGTHIIFDKEINLISVC
ncbi:BnaA08g06580D [Brassica napus]|uniref:BnaA08g06580D protein n=1 Tax=Brassica napus TaxID=3708 RepID=A0A078I6D1_BRANA|nr:BnaA08g06580D [Brassica napus]